MLCMIALVPLTMLCMVHEFDNTAAGMPFKKDTNLGPVIFLLSSSVYILTFLTISCLFFSLRLMWQRKSTISWPRVSAKRLADTRLVKCLELFSCIITASLSESLLGSSTATCRFKMLMSFLSSFPFLVFVNSI